LIHRIEKRRVRDRREFKIEPVPQTVPSPKISVVIPIRDRVDLLDACIRGLREKTVGADLDIIIIDNESREPATLELLAQLEARSIIHRHRLPGAFNFSRACNIGVGLAKNELILLLNNDVEPISDTWLLTLASELEDSTVGAVGANLLFPDGFTQHGGTLLGAGSVARHHFHFVHPSSNEHLGLLRHRRDVSAVTAACLLTRKSLWEKVGGMDENTLRVAFNDVDFCLKLRMNGLRIVWTPGATLIHRESVSRGSDKTKEKMARFASEERTMRERWGEILLNDPCYSPNLSLVAEEFVLEAFPRDLSPRTASLLGRFVSHDVDRL
jgi:GT2 family glycosyltransferase